MRFLTVCVIIFSVFVFGLLMYGSIALAAYEMEELDAMEEEYGVRIRDNGEFKCFKFCGEDEKYFYSISFFGANSCICGDEK